MREGLDDDHGATVRAVKSLVLKRPPQLAVDGAANIAKPPGAAGDEVGPTIGAAAATAAPITVTQGLRNIRFLNAERSPKEYQCGDQPNCEQQGRGPTDKVPGHFSFTPFLREGLLGIYGDDLRPSHTTTWH